jgi:signal peptidase I
MQTSEEQPTGSSSSAEPRRGFFGTMLFVTLSPKRFFEPSGEFPTRVSPLVFTVGAYTLAGFLFGFGALAEGLTVDEVAGLAPTMALAGALLALPQLYLYAAAAQLAARVFGGTSTFNGTLRVLAYASAPMVALGLSWLSVLTLWSYAIAVVGLSRVHAIGYGRAFAVILSPFLVSVVFAGGLRAFVVEAFKVPSGSMQPTIMAGDHLFVWKSAYGLSRGVPERGDVIVFEAPGPGVEADYVKRVAGLPGDVVRVERGQLVINDARVPSCWVGKLDASDLHVEFLGGSPHLIQVETDLSDPEEGPFRVDHGEVFVIGDSRSNSADSRSWARHGGNGGVPFANIKGRAARIWMPIERWGNLRDIRAEELPDELRARLVECLARGSNETSL